MNEYYHKYKKYKSKLKQVQQHLSYDPYLQAGSPLKCLCEQSGNIPQTLNITLEKSSPDTQVHLQLEDIQAIQLELETQGYVVIPNVVSSEDVSEVRNQILTYLHQLPRIKGKEINLDDITTKLDKPKTKELYDVWPMHKTFGAPTELDIFHLPMFWKIREDRSLYNLYTHLLDSKRLLANIDRASIKLPGQGEEEFIHIDRDPTHWSDSAPLQSMIFFSDGHFHAIPKSHTQIFHQNIVDTYQIKKLNKPRSMYMIDKKKDKEKLKLVEQLQAIPVLTGSLIIWSENLWHASIPNTSNYIRLALYFGYHRIDKGESPNTIIERLQSFYSGRLPPKLPGGEKVYLVPKKYYNFPKKILPYLAIIPPEYHGTHTIKSTQKIVPWLDEEKYDPIKINNYQPYQLSQLGQKLLGSRDWD